MRSRALKAIDTLGYSQNRSERVDLVSFDIRGGMFEAAGTSCSSSASAN